MVYDAARAMTFASHKHNFIVRNTVVHFLPDDHDHYQCGSLICYAE